MTIHLGIEKGAIDRFLESEYFKRSMNSLNIRQVAENLRDDAMRCAPKSSGAAGFIAD